MVEGQVPRKVRERLRQREEILSAALELFSEKGYRNVSMQEIAQKAEFGVGTLYNFFQSKEDLYKALVKTYAERFHKAILDAMEGLGDEVEKLRAFIRAKIQLFKENQAVIRLYIAETTNLAITVKAGLESDIKILYRSFLDTLAKVFEDGINKGIFHGINSPFYLALAIDSFTSNLLFWRLDDPQGFPIPSDPDTLLNIFFKPLLKEA